MAKKSRRVRRQQAEKQKKSGGTSVASKVQEAPVMPTPVAPAAPEVELDQVAASRKSVNFAQEYFYVYNEVRNILIIAILMLVVLFGLAVVI